MANQTHDKQPASRPFGALPRAEQDKRDADEQSGSTGRNPGTGDEKQDGKNTGQDDYGMTGGADRDPPRPGHESGSSGTSEYGRSDYGEPGEPEPEGSKETPVREKPPTKRQRRD
jgi:hypothetical protein